MAESAMNVGAKGCLIEFLASGSAYVFICCAPLSAPDENKLSAILDKIEISGRTNLGTLATPKVPKCIACLRKRACRIT